MTTPYIYKLTFVPQGKFYIGSRTANGCHPDEFWTKYFTSSKDIARLIAQHGTTTDVWQFEILQQFDASIKPTDVVRIEHDTIYSTITTTGAKTLLNNSYNRFGEHVFTVAGRVRPQSERDAIGKARLGMPKTKQQIERHRQAMQGRTISDEHKSKISSKLIGHPVSQKTKDAVSSRQQKWNNCSATPESTKRYLLAADIYSKWIETGFGYSKLGQLFGEPAKSTKLQSMVNMFKAGWVPNEDPDWLAFFDLNATST